MLCTSVVQPATSAQFVGLLAAGRVCKESRGDDGMRKASTRMPEQGTQRRPLLRTSSPLKPKNQPRTNIETGTTNGGTSCWQCGQIQVGVGGSCLFRVRGIAALARRLVARYNIAPTQSVPVIRQHPKESVRQLSLMKWGPIPNCARTPSMATGTRPLYASADTSDSTPRLRTWRRFQRPVCEMMSGAVTAVSILPSGTVGWDRQ